MFLKMFMVHLIPNSSCGRKRDNSTKQVDTNENKEAKYKIYTVNLRTKETYIQNIANLRKVEPILC